ncbi:MAG: 5-formyltetrahydrofolate cyclo-ligase [Wolbachia endosymbiont of Menacanthus eurysternus]|nr:MAG: 5-formyltetrahydrofolate cyclo-ligase [Wolbachia endosymbiont of Menacanthus eurysternus]
MDRRNIKQQKRKIRKQYRTIRKNLDEKYSSNARSFVVNSFKKNLANLVRSKTVAAYIPIDGEIDIIPLMYNLLYLSYRVVVPWQNKPLRFKEWNMVRGGLNNKNIIPDIIITPVIAFDDHFNRLGFGSGCYDFVIKELRSLGKIFIGVAYERQYCKILPIEEHDQKLDIIITETRVMYNN